MKSLKRVEPPTATAAKPMSNRSFSRSSFCTMRAARGEARTTPSVKASMRYRFSWVMEKTKVRNPMRLTGNSENDWMETAAFSSMPDRRPPVVTMGPNPLPLRPLLNAPRRLITTIFVQEKLI